ncbi:hypothetical protein VNO80_06568 [Phaseolus coccineus]|uniref:Tetrahydrofolate dehydrogenase/cyclohydrolase NAD(P)-binding domain-containing protein n=1 Tax=Phaseolus coccineus TaxID=3886 RepID=A0AAN9NH29_PHACN
MAYNAKRNCIFFPAPPSCAFLSSTLLDVWLPREHTPPHTIFPKNLQWANGHNDVTLEGKEIAKRIKLRFCVVDVASNALVIHHLFGRGTSQPSTCDMHTQNPEQITSEADIVVADVGIPNIVRGNWIKKGDVVIDMGAKTKFK